MHFILQLFKNPLEEMLESENMILNATEVKIIFGNLPPIFDIHSNMLEELKWGIHNWKEDFCIGSVILKFVSFNLNVCLIVCKNATLCKLLGEGRGGGRVALNWACV